ncbi:hypothetical protein TWF173_011199 [Orbilia oligospora]|nr:hypothetical protein TWF173_011199 [Orbilia oligospora]
MTTDTTQPAAPTSHPTSTSTTSAAVPIPTSTSNPHPRSVPLARTSSASSSVSGGIPTRHRPANVAELHQELEREQEGVVNRLLGQITRVAQNVAATHPGTNPDDIAAAAVPLSASPQLAAPIHSGPPGHHHHPPSVTDMPSSFSPAIGRSRSPAPSGHHGYGVGMESSVWPQTANDPFLMGGRDEVAFYKAETDMLLRENEMLKRRIKELEDKASGGAEGSTSSANVPAASSESKENAPAGTA